MSAPVSPLQDRRLHVWRGRLRWRVVGFDFLCGRCWRYSEGDIPWCGNTHCRDPRWFNVVRRWRRKHLAIKL